jgi:hypothetical protein
MNLKHDSLIFQTSAGEDIPCSAEWVTLELLGDAACQVEPEMIRNASAAVLHYFKEELNRTYVSISEFADALEKVLRGLGFQVLSDPPAVTPPRVSEGDLRHIVNAGNGCELFFFQTLREDLKKRLSESPQVVAFRGLRGSVKILLGAERWSAKCQILADHIVEYMRTCWSSDFGSEKCALVVL